MSGTDAPRGLADANPEDLFTHAITGALIVVVEHNGDELMTVQLNDAEGHGPGWIAYLWPNAAGWSFVGKAK